MTSAQQFLESFLQAKAAAYAEANLRLSPLFATYFGEPLSKHTPSFLMRDPARAVFEDVKQSANSAVVVTREPAPRNAILRTRYQLAAVGESWKIIRMDRECYICRGSGRMEGMVCHKCEGDGWYDPQKDAASTTKAM
jgi:hypothetical protein